MRTEVYEILHELENDAEFNTALRKALNDAANRLTISTGVPVGTFTPLEFSHLRLILAADPLAVHPTTNGEEVVVYDILCKNPPCEGNSFGGP
ncbi:hypothetical protein [Nevskia sp.]|uniref:hypothetical protein n=1 Tax=Nevskia sp. TaxID=1929292 RepID=UPI0025FCE9A5|nr:hypothetical protein [Nevskia sp.]